MNPSDDSHTWSDITDYDGLVIGRYAVDEYYPPLRLFVHVELDEAYRGRIAVRACRRHMRELFATYPVEAIYVGTHKREGAAFAALCGFTRVGHFPRFLILDSSIVDAWVYRITENDLDG